MKRDMDLVRKIFFAMEENDHQTAISENFLPKIEGYSNQQIMYHMQIMAQADLLHVEKFELPQLKDDFLTTPRLFSTSYSLSWNGHEFLDAARDNARWEKAKGAMAQAGGFALDVMKQLLIQYLKAELRLT